MSSQVGSGTLAVVQDALPAKARVAAKDSVYLSPLLS